MAGQDNGWMVPEGRMTTIEIGCSNCPYAARTVAMDKHVGMYAVQLISTVPAEVPYTIKEFENREVHWVRGNPYPHDENYACTEPCPFLPDQLSNIGAYVVMSIQNNMAPDFRFVSSASVQDRINIGKRQGS